MHRLFACAPRNACIFLQRCSFSASKGANFNRAMATLSNPAAKVSVKPSPPAAAPPAADVSARDLMSAVAAVGGSTGESYWDYQTLESKWVQRLMQDGRKETALLLHNKMLAQLKLLYPDKDPRDLFAAAVLRARPFAEVKSMRVGGSSYRVPVEIPEKRQRSLVLRWMVLHARKR
jgi:hypothetical protein